MNEKLTDVQGCVPDEVIAASINALAERQHRASVVAGWWDDTDILNGDPDKYIVGTKLALVHSEVSEALEAYRRDAVDDHLPHRSGIECEIADGILRLLDISGVLRLDVGGALIEKMAYNAQRADHTLAARSERGGKKF